MKSEILSSLVIDELVEDENLVLDDKPDLKNLSSTMAYEIVQCDLDEDLNLKYIFETMSSNDYDYHRTIESLKNERKIELSNYLITETDDGKVGCIMAAEIGRTQHYFLPLFEKNFRNKLNKLNKCNYDNSTNISLVVLSISRLKTTEDTKKIFEAFNAINNEFDRKFVQLFLITTSGLYFAKDGCINYKKIDAIDFNHFITLTNDLISMVKEKQCLYTEYPSIACEWHPTKNNGLLPYNVSSKSNKKVWWKCSKGHDFEGIIYNRVKQQSKCTICANKKVLSGFNDLATTHPHLAEEWDYEKNHPLKPSQIRYGTDKKYWWICPECHNSYEASPNIRASQDTGCPYCAGRKVLIGFNDLLTKRPDIAAEWNYEKNGQLLPSMFTEKSGRQVWWKCEKGHEWKCDIAQRTTGKGTRCPQCQSGLSTSFPELAIFFYIKKKYSDAVNRFKNPEKNISELDIFIPSLNVGIEYNGCHYHNKSSDSYKRMQIEKSGIRLICVNESKNKIKPHFKDDNIYINHRFSFEEIGYAVKTIFRLIDVEISIPIDVNKDSLDIYKMQSKILDENSLGAKVPRLIEEWNWEKNQNLSPFDFSYNSHFSVWWRCKRGHEWMAPINNRAKTNGTNCPYCSNQKVLEGFNDFASLHPELLSDWDYSKNIIKPSEIVEKSNKIIHWKCHICGHEWKTSPAIRIKKMCPNCVKKNHRIKILNLDNGLEFDSLVEAAIWLGDIKYASGISLAIRGKRKSAYGFHWKSLNDDK